MEQSKSNFELSAEDSRLHRYFDREKRDDPAFLAEQNEPEQVIDTEVRKENRRRDIEEALGGLDAIDRAIVILVAQRGMSIRDVASTLDIPKSTVQERFRTSKTILARCLAKYQCDR